MRKTFSALFSDGFRPFFLGAGIYAVLSVFLWMGAYAFSWNIRPNHLPAVFWHGHEMIFGYTLAGIAGFLLAAVQTWTKFETIKGFPLFLLTIPWVVSRILMFTEWAPLRVPLILDTLFILALLSVLAYPIVKAKQWKNFGLVINLLFLAGCNIVFYLGAAGILPDGIRIGLQSGLYMVIAFVMLIGARIIPLLTEKGVDYPVRLKNWPLINHASLFFFIGFFVFDVWDTRSLITAIFAAVLALVLSIRLLGWYTHGIWKNPLLWILYMTYASIVLGFTLKVLSYTNGIGTHLVTHAFGYGAIGLSTLGIMSRLSWAHTGRNIRSLPKIIRWLFLALAMGLIFRVFAPLFLPNQYHLFILGSQLAWLFAFSGFIFAYAPIFFAPRIDAP
ncbi:MAG: hypothetical protein ACI9BD_001416 [Candidatus Marinamargulisbacteria bacterium]|jgi:uncharacterized protein involved in response to NO